MIVVFCTGLIIGTVAGMFSWLVAAAYLETKKTAPGVIANLVVQPELARAAREAPFRPAEASTRRVYRQRGGRVALVVDRETTHETAHETTRPSVSL